MENNKTPSIRFKGFTDPWEQRKFGDGMDLLTGFPFESEKFSDNGINLIRGMNVKRGYLDLSDSLCMKWKSSEGLEKYLLENEDILIQMDGALIGKSYAKIKESQLPALLVQRVTRARAIPEDSNSDFMYQTIQRDFLKYIILNKTDSAVPHLSLNDIREFPIRVPNLEEQKKIGEYLYNLDNLIALHQRKYNKLLNVKKSMLEKMFPKNGSNIPEIRFKGFTDPWEQRKVLDLLELLTDYDANGSFADMAKNINTTDGDGYAWYVRITDLENPKPLSELKYVDESSYEFLKKTELHGGELLMAKRGNIGKVYIFEPRTKCATVAPNMYLLKLNNKVIPHFLYDYFVSEEGNKKLTRLNASSTMGALYKDDVKNIDVIMPSIEEQAMIGNFFQSIDHIITLHQRELEKLQNIKKSMLEKMFV